MRCPCCMEEHEVQTITVMENNVFKSVPVEYMAEYFYCDQADALSYKRRGHSISGLVYRALPIGAVGE